MAVALGQTNVEALFGESGIGIVLAQQNAVFSPGGEHAVGFVYTLGHKVVDEHTNVGLVAPQSQLALRLSRAWVGTCMQGSVHAGNETLSGSFFITGGTVHLSGHKKTPHNFRFQGMVQLCGVEEIVFYGIAGAVYSHVAQSRNLSKGIQLHLNGHARREAVQVHFVGVHPLGFDEQGVLRAVGEGNELGFYRRTVARSDALDLSVVERRVGQSAPEHLVHLFVGVASPARQLG